MCMESVQNATVSFHVCSALCSLSSALCSSSNVVSTLESEFTTVCDLRDQMLQNESWWRGPCCGSKGSTCWQAKPSASWTLELTAGSKQALNGPWSRIGREFGQSPVYIRAYVGWWRPDFSLIQFCNRNFSCGVNARPLEKDVHLLLRAWRFGLLCNRSVQRWKACSCFGEWSIMLNFGY